MCVESLCASLCANVITELNLYNSIRNHVLFLSWLSQVENRRFDQVSNLLCVRQLVGRVRILSS